MERIETFKEFAKYILKNDLEVYGRNGNRCLIRNTAIKFDKRVIEVWFNTLLETN